MLPHPIPASRAVPAKYLAAGEKERGGKSWDENERRKNKVKGSGKRGPMSDISNFFSLSDASPSPTSASACAPAERRSPSSNSGLFKSPIEQLKRRAKVEVVTATTPTMQGLSQPKRGKIGVKTPSPSGEKTASAGVNGDEKRRVERSRPALLQVTPHLTAAHSPTLSSGGAKTKGDGRHSPSISPSFTPSSSVATSTYLMASSQEGRKKGGGGKASPALSSTSSASTFSSSSSAGKSHHSHSHSHSRSRMSRVDGAYKQVLSPDLSIGVVTPEAGRCHQVGGGSGGGEKRKKKKGKDEKEGEKEEDERRLKALFLAAADEVEEVHAGDKGEEEKDGDVELVLRAVSDVEKRIREVAQAGVTEAIRCNALTDSGRVYHAASMNMWRPVFSPLPFLTTSSSSDATPHQKLLPPLTNTATPASSASTCTPSSTMTATPSSSNGTEVDTAKGSCDSGASAGRTEMDGSEKKAELDEEEVEVMIDPKQNLKHVFQKLGDDRVCIPRVPLSMMRAKDIVPLTTSDSITHSLEENEKAMQRCEELRSELEVIRSNLSKMGEKKGANQDNTKEEEGVSLDEIGQLTLSSLTTSEEKEDGDDVSEYESEMMQKKEEIASTSYLTYRRAEQLSSFLEVTAKEKKVHDKVLKSVQDCFNSLQEVEEKYKEGEKAAEDEYGITSEYAMRKRLQAEAQREEIAQLRKDLSAARTSIIRQEEDTVMEEMMYENALRKKDPAALSAGVDRKKDRTMRRARLARAQKAIVKVEVFLRRFRTLEKAKLSFKPSAQQGQ